MIINYAGASGSRVAYYAAQILAEYDKALILVSSEAAASRLREDLSFFVNAEIHVLPEEEDFKVLYDARDTSRLVSWIRSINALLGERRAVVIAPTSTAVRALPLPERFRENCMTVSVGQVLDPADFRRRLTAAGYLHTEVTESHGEFSTRGDIIDVHAATMDDPVRIEFFGDEVDSIRLYDRNT